MRVTTTLLSLLAALSCTQASATKLAIIIDDIGYHLENGYRSAQLPVAVTLSVIPHSPNARELATAGHDAGKEIMLHIPMSTDKPRTLDKGGLTDKMSEAEFKSTVRQGLAAVPHIVGVNNHMGSALTQQPRAMQWLMDELKDTPYYFIDSRTSPNSQAHRIAQENRIPSATRHVFLDNSRKHQDILVQLEKAVKRAQRSGSAVVIGHPHPETLEVLERIGPALAKAGIEFVHASALISRTSSQNQLSKVDLDP